VNIRQPNALTKHFGGQGQPKRSRWILGLALVPIPTVSALAIARMSDGSWKAGVVAGWYLLAAEVVSYAIGSIFITVVVRRRRPVDVASCLLLGALAGFPVMFFGRLLQFAITGVREHDVLFLSPIAIVLTGTAQATFGLAGGWLLWLVSGLRQVPPRGSSQAHARLWRDLRLWRLGIGGLIYVAFLAVVAATFIAFSGDRSYTDLPPKQLGLIVIGFVFVWPLFGWSSWFAVVLRMHGLIGRAHCLIAGALIAFLDPLILPVFASLLSGGIHASVYGGLRNLIDAVWSGALIAPVGLLGGWIFWRIAIRPAPMPQPSDWSVFD
jgi:hypothetical protein